MNNGVWTWMSYWRKCFFPRSVLILLHDYWENIVNLFNKMFNISFHHVQWAWWRENQRMTRFLTDSINFIYTQHTCEKAMEKLLLIWHITTAKTIYHRSKSLCFFILFTPIQRFYGDSTIWKRPLNFFFVFLDNHLGRQCSPSFYRSLSRFFLLFSAWDLISLSKLETMETAMKRSTTKFSYANSMLLTKCKSFEWTE